MTNIRETEDSIEISPHKNSAIKKQKIPKKWWRWGSFFLLGLILALGLYQLVAPTIEHFVSTVENIYQNWFSEQDTTNPIVLLPLAFLGGLIASISPCILALLPVNLSYIGTLKIQSRWDAFTKAGLFVLGSVTILSLFGLVSSFAGAVMVEYRGYINIVVGFIMGVMGLWLMGVIKIPLPQMNVPVPKAAGPYGVGLTFALVSSPCASPVLFAVLAAAAATGSQLLATLTMVSYALGYTMLIFLSSLFTGLAKQSNKLLKHSETIILIGSIALIGTGTHYLFIGTQWFLGG
jgi:cytochrome c-type biogenesis protein